MYEDPKSLPPITDVRTTEQKMLESLVRIEGLLTGLLTSAETQVNGLRHIAQVLAGPQQQAGATQEPKSGTRRRGS